MNKIVKPHSSAMATLLAILIVEILSPGLTEARCRVVPVPERLQRSQAVFIGKVISIEVAERTEQVKLKITKSWKGPLRGEVVISNSRHHEASRYQEGRSYLVFAANYEGNLWTGICSGTVNVESAGAEIKMLDRLRKRKR
jgi:hypothetical protein